MGVKGVGKFTFVARAVCDSDGAGAELGCPSRAVVWGGHVLDYLEKSMVVKSGLQVCGGEDRLMKSSSRSTIQATFDKAYLGYYINARLVADFVQMLLRKIMSVERGGECL